MNDGTMMTGLMNMAPQDTLPNGRILLDGMGFSVERLQTGSKAAVSLPVIKALLSAAAAALPFDPDFYRDTYADIRKAYEAGKIKNLQTHFTEIGYLEGRMGATPDFDEDFYKATYPDVAGAIAKGAVKSALDHYIHAGAFEGRHATASAMDSNKKWSELLRPI
jgi:hypothetical protein